MNPTRSTYPLKNASTTSNCTILMLFLLMSAIAFVVSEGLCQGNWTLIEASLTCINVFKINLGYAEAKLKCGSFEGNLLTLTEEKIATVKDLLSKENQSEPFWISKDLEEVTRTSMNDIRQGLICPYTNAHKLENINGNKELWDLNDCTSKDSYICETVPETCEHNKYGAKCNKTCSPNCGGLNKSCHSITGDCLHGCDEHFTGAKCVDHPAVLFTISAKTTAVGFGAAMFIVIICLYMLSRGSDDEFQEHLKERHESSSYGESAEDDSGVQENDE